MVALTWDLDHELDDARALRLEFVREIFLVLELVCGMDGKGRQQGGGNR